MPDPKREKKQPSSAARQTENAEENALGISPSVDPGVELSNQ